MCNERNALLLKEYELLVSQYQHEDNLVEKRKNTFIILNLAMLGAIKFLSTEPSMKDLPNLEWWIPIMSAFGIVHCVCWFLVNRSGRYYVKLRMEQAVSIENEIGTLKMFSIEENVVYNKIKIIERGREFSPLPRFSSLAYSVAYILSIGFSLIWIIVIYLSF